MAGYRHTSYDPYAHDLPGPPLRPYGKAQRLGVVLGAIGVALVTLDLLAKLGVTARWIGDPSPWSLILLVTGMLLVNSRRGPGVSVGREQVERNRRTLAITAAVCAILLGLAAVIEFTGAF